MSTLVRSTFQALPLVLAASTCLALAYNTNSVLDDWLQPSPCVETPAPPKKQPKEELPTPLALAPLARYLGLPDKLREQVIPTEPTDEARPTVLDLKLLGTMLSSRPETSLASVYEGATRRTRSVWVGGELQGAQVVAIERTRVLLLSAGRLEFIGPESTTATGGKDPRASTPAAPASTSSPGISVQQVGPGSYEISRQELDTVLANPNQLLMQARVVPAFRDGKAQGFKMFSIRPDSLYSRIGLQNGDVMQRINGLSLDSVEQGLYAFQKLRESPRIELEVERNGQPMRLTYSLR
jgi:general secretion pathway protein C